MTVPPGRPDIDLGIDLDESKTVPIKNIYAGSYDQLEELYGYIKRSESRGWIRRVKSGHPTQIIFVNEEDGKLRL